MKIGCTAWTIAGGYDLPFDEAVDTIGRMGFHGIELIAGSREQIYDYYTDDQCDKLVSQIDEYGMVTSQFVLHKTLIDGLASLNRHDQEKALQVFEKGCHIAKRLNANIINTVSHSVPGLRAPIPYLPSYVYVTVPGVEWFEPKMKMTMPDFDWDNIWNNYILSVRRCCDIAAGYGLSFSLEGHPHVIVSHTDSFLRFYGEVQRDNFGMNFDTAMQADQREHIPISIRKLKHRIIHMHVRDSDSLVTHRLPVGKGVLDWQAILSELKRANYRGFMSIELGKYADPVKWVRESQTYLQSLLKEIEKAS
ncbi:sugar phosphate isomerase/epimerase [Melghirimyces profundicolus]|uniref:Sugar phosphate isomerase/epimerase n=1 Tax=Melghirimyces profundicolus TaxID=1242148 RepID=A0A2T6AV20_9BACL|nr:sugar phosphate isomerase/epimerase family protein [Melghirimyces profundicolus]PTX47668.1 sugar phosphate isomerase/epimerase [Melghirimyces profundicolus]